MDIVKILIDAGRAAVGVPAAAYALSAIGLNLQFGYTGLLNFGHVAFMGVGAYTAAANAYNAFSDEDRSAAEPKPSLRSSPFL